MSQLNFETPERAIRLPFGKYANQFLSEVPLEYLVWAEENLIFPAYSVAIVEELNRRQGNRPGAGKIVKRGK